MSDRTGNTLISARSFGNLDLAPFTSSITLNEAVNSQDKNDLYRFRLSQRSSLNLQLSGIQKGAKLRVELLTLKGKSDKVLRRIGRIEFSDLKPSSRRNSLTFIDRATASSRSTLSLNTLLNAGEYYLNIARIRSESQYQLQVTAKADSPIPPTAPPATPPATPPTTPPATGGGSPGSSNGSGGSSNPPTSLTTVLYDGDGLPQDDSWIRYGRLPLFGNPASQTAVTGGVTLNTQFSSTDPTRGYAGYSNYAPSPRTLTPQLVNSDFPTLDPNKGFTLSFRLSVNSEQSNPNRAGFSVILLGNNAQGIELGFKSNRIFAQSDTFTEAETATPSFSLNTAIDYQLAVQGNTYQLFANNSSILNGSLRSYQFNPVTSDPPLPFNPYSLKNFLFFGDNTDQGGANVTIGAISIAS